METLLTESMICYATLLRTAGNFRQDGTQLELIEYHAGRYGAVRRSLSTDQPGSRGHHRSAEYCASPAWHGGRERCRRSSCRAVREDGPEFFAKPSKRLLVGRLRCQKERCDGQSHPAILRSPGCR